MCLWYDLGTTLSILEQTGTTDSFMKATFEKIGDITEDFEIKRFILGLSALLVQ